jgi:hypothetical protein
VSKCVICGNQTEKHICRSKECIAAFPDWLAENFDKLQPNSALRRRYENEFWTISEEQKKHYARFFELLIPKQPRKIRYCLKCREPLDNAKTGGRLCASCNQSNQQYGALI